MSSLRFAVAASAAAVVSASASAGVVTFVNQVLWTNFSTGQGKSVATETFGGVADGFYAAPVSGSVAGITWEGSAANGIYVDGGLFSTNFAEPMTFTFSPGVHGVAGNIFGTDINFNIVPSIVQVTLSNGSSYIGFTSSANDFIGFYSTDAAITSMTITKTGTGAGAVFPTVDNLYFAVPAPGAMALLGVAGLVSGRRVRR
jgi:hypothetical protein